jgi:lipoprotein-releasing system permease protein
MYFPLRIAFRYLVAKKKATFISLISWLAMSGIAFGTSAIIIVLSVFNGLEDLNRSLFKTFDSDLIALPLTGKKFDAASLNNLNSRKLTNIKNVNGVIQENALVKYGDQQCVATIKGVQNSFLENADFKNSIVEGKFTLIQDSTFQAIVGIGIQQNLSIDTGNFYTPIEFWFPNKDANLNLATESSFNKVSAFPSSVFSIEQSYDNYIIVPIELTKQLFDRKNELSAIEINLKSTENIEETKKQLMPILGNKLKILTRDEQHIGLLKAIKFEKLFVFLALIFITGIAALNIFFSLSMLVIEKTEDIKTLKAIGTNNNTIKRIFQIEGALISVAGSILGMTIGLGVCWLQLKYGFLKMGMVSALVDAYPVRIELLDVVYTAIALVIITLIISQFPSKKASKIN